MKPIVTEAAELMIEGMKSLRDGKITPQEATSLAQLGIAVVQAANAEVNFIKATKGLPKGGSFGQDVQFLEP